MVSPAGTLFAYIPWMVMWNSNVLASAGTLCVHFALPLLRCLQRRADRLDQACLLCCCLRTVSLHPPLLLPVFVPDGNSPRASQQLQGTIRPLCFQVSQQQQRHINFLSPQILRISRSSKGAGAATTQEINKILSDVCPMGVQLDKEEYVSDHPSCIHCGKCVAESPANFAQTMFD